MRSMIASARGLALPPSSRFSHTIGVTEVADRMASVITQKLNVTPNDTSQRLKYIL